MPAPIFSSPFLNLSVINSLLSSTSNPPIPVQRIQLLSATLHLLTNPPSISASSPSSSTGVERGRTRASELENPTEVMRVRLDLAKAHLALEVPDLRTAEVELTGIEGAAEGVMKRLRGRRKDRGEEGRGGEGDEGGEGGREGGEGGESGSGINVEGKDPPWLAEMGRLRVEALRVLVGVEEGLGRDGRVRRWRELIGKLEGDHRVG